MAEQSEYNGSTEILNKIDHLLQSKKITTSAALSTLLEAHKHQIKETHEVKKRVAELEAHWTNKVTPKGALITFFILYSFSISDIREPVMQFVGSVLGTLVKLL